MDEQVNQQIQGAWEITRVFNVHSFSAPIYAMILEKRGAVQAWRDLMGPTNSIKAREEHPER